MKKNMLINVLQPEECRIAILENGVLEELYVERTSRESYVGNIYKGRIVNIEPSIQAAFVDFGVGRNGFLHVSDVEPTYYRHLEQRGGRGDRGDRYDRGDRRGRDRGRGDQDRDRGRQRREPAEGAPEKPVTRDEAAPAPDPTEYVAEAVISEVPPADVAPPEGSLPMDPTAEPVVADEGEAPVVADPETVTLGEEPGKGRRRSRGGARRKRGQPAKGEVAKPDDDSAAGGAEEQAAADPEPPKPRLMDSAEHRTTPRDSGPFSEPEITMPGGGISDDDLLFFPSRPAAPAAPPAPEPPVSEPAPEPVEAPPRAAPEPRRPPARPRPARSHGSIEDDLEADLAAAESGEEFSFPPTVKDDFVPPSPAEDEAAPVSAGDDAVAPAAELSEEGARDFEEPFDDGFDREVEADFEAERFEERGGRDGGRGRERGQRERGRGRGDRGDRGDHRPRRGGGRPGLGRPKPLIQDIFKRGQEVIVQVIKEGIGTKGPTLSTYISIAGRYLVLMPGLNRTGVSRKIMDDEQRRRLRDMFNELKPPRGVGFIMRTAAIDRNKKELQSDLAYLSRLWTVVVKRIKKLKSPAEIYQESDIVTRTIRDSFTSDVESIVIDEPGQFEQAREFMQIVMPRYASRIQHYDGKDPLFHHHGIEEEIHRIQQKKVPLPSGGSIVIEQTEALVAIDVNSGSFRGERLDAEETAFQMNLHAAKEIARQMRLRDLTGIIVNDFIDMRDEKHRRAVEKALRDAVKRDRARTKILKTSQFGIIEMTRQRTRDSLKKSIYKECPYCLGMAHVKTCESMSLEVMRLLQLAAFRENVKRIEVRVAVDVAGYLQNRKRRDIAKMEEERSITVQIAGAHDVPPELLEFVCYDNNGNEAKVLPAQEPPAARRR
jgi:ribonuclease E